MKLLVTATENLSGHPAFSLAPLTPSFLDYLDHLNSQFSAFSQTSPELLTFHVSKNHGWRLVHGGLEHDAPANKALSDALDDAGQEHLVLPEGHPLLAGLNELATNYLHLKVCQDGVALEGHVRYDEDTYTSTFVDVAAVRLAISKQGA